MFLFNTVDANGGDVAGIVYHEITHGLACRLITNASGSCALGPIQSGMMNEAWADYFSTDLLVAQGGLADTATPAELKLGNHVVPGGIRAKPTDCPVNPAGVGGCNGDFGDPGARRLHVRRPRGHGQHQPAQRRRGVGRDAVGPAQRRRP